MSAFRLCPLRLLPLLLGSLLGGTLALSSISVLAQVPPVLHYQATLAENTLPVDAVVDLEVSFYADSTGGTPLAGWSETRTDVTVTNGRIHLLLGSQTPLPDALFDGPRLYLQLTVDDTVFPRMRIASTAYALRARRAEGAAPGSISAEALADGSVTASALATNAVTTDAVAEGTITAPLLADEAVISGKLASEAITARALANGAVTSTKIGPSAVVGSALADGAVSTAKLTNGAVTASKIATGALVTTLNGLTDAVRLVAGDNVTITSSANAGTITIAIDEDALERGSGLPSSRRWKTNVQPLDGLALVRELRGVRYEWMKDGTPDVGLIAEEVGTVVPEVVTYAPNGIDAESVNYAKLVALLIEAVKEQQTQIEADRTRLRALESRIKALERATRSHPPTPSSPETSSP